MEEPEARDEDGGESGEELRDPPAEEQDPESAPASDPPPGQEPGEGKSHDL